MKPLNLFLIAAIAYLLFFQGLGRSSLWDPDEPRQAIEAREMMERTDYIHPYLNGEPYLEKPPLYPWLIILTARISGKLDEWSARLPSAVLASLALILTYLLGRRLADETAGLLSALVFATNFQVLGNARESVMDMAFASFIALTIFLGYTALERRSRGLMIVAFLPSALAFLAKGPAGLLIPTCVLFIMTVVRREFRRQILPLGAGCVVSLAIASIWFIAAGEAYAKEFLLRQNLTRYTNAFDHAESVWYYFHKIFFNFLPWSVFLPFALVHGLRRRLWLPLVWFGFIFLFFEFSTSKRAVYLLPLYPAAALLVGVYIRERWASLLERTWSNWLIFVGGILITALPVALYVVGPMLHRYGPIIHETRLQVFGSMALLAAAGIAFLISVRKKAFAPSLTSLIFYVFVLGFTYAVVYVPAADRHFKSPHRIADAALAIASNADVYTHGFNSPGLIYYLGRPVKILRAPGDVAAQGDVMVITDQRQEDAKKTFPSLSVRKEVKYEKEVFTILTRGHEG